MITLNGVSLSEDMLWTDRDQYSSVLQTVKMRLGAVPLVFAASLTKGRPITLKAETDQGWLTLAQVTALQEMAASAGTSYSLTIGTESFTVVFRHQDSPAVSFTPLIPKAVPQSGDYFTGELKLMTV